jgi:hypothetical protein
VGSLASCSIAPQRSATIIGEPVATCPERATFGAASRDCTNIDYRVPRRRPSHARDATCSRAGVLRCATAVMFAGAAPGRPALHVLDVSQSAAPAAPRELLGYRLPPSVAPRALLGSGRSSGIAPHSSVHCAEERLLHARESRLAVCDALSRRSATVRAGHVCVMCS